MKFSVSSSALSQHLQIVSKLINPKAVGVVPVLANILFELEGNVLTLTAADLNNRLTSSLEVMNQGGDGSFIVPERIIIDSLRELPDQPITIDVDDQSYVSRLSYNNGRYDFCSSASESYPESLQLEGKTGSVELPAESLLAALNATKAAAGVDERRPIMTGVLLDFQQDKLVSVASDGRILVRYTDTRIQSAEERKICLPPAIYKLLSSTLLPREAGSIKLAFDDKFLQVIMGSYILTARLLDGSYPAYNSVIPPTSPHHIVVSREALLSAARRISIFASKASKVIQFDMTKEQILLKASDIDFSINAEETISCQSDDLEELRIGFDFDLLKTLLEIYTSEEVTIGLADRTRAAVITPITQPSEGTEVLSLIIPIKLINEI